MKKKENSMFFRWQNGFLVLERKTFLANATGFPNDEISIEKSIKTDLKINSSQMTCQGSVRQTVNISGSRKVFPHR